MIEALVFKNTFNRMDEMFHNSSFLHDILHSREVNAKNEKKID